MKNWLLQVLCILLLASVTALVVNAVREDGINIIGNWPSRTASGDEAVVPPSAQEGDPPFITLDDAVARYQSPDVVFVDARDPEDFEWGHILRAINIPFDYLDENWEAVIATLDKNAEYVIYCSGTECESSLFLARYFEQLGFAKIHVFYGGWSEWASNKLPVIGEGVNAKGEES